MAIPATASARMRLALLLCLLGLTTGLAQDSPSPSPNLTPPSETATPSPPPRSVLLRFALPPLAGTISLGIYDDGGKLVRILHREDNISEFTQGHDAPETTWDGMNDEGQALPAGKYHARGYLVGDEVKVEGVAYFFNDWVTDEHSPHIRSLGQLRMESGVLEINASLTGGTETTLICDQATGAIKGQLPPRSGPHCVDTPTLPNLVSPIDCAAGRKHTTWFVDSMGGTGPAEVKQISSDHQLLRRLAYAPNDPQPRRIEASPNEEKIFLIEQNDHLQRLRALRLVRTTAESANESVSDWQPLFEKKIVAHESFGLESGKPVATSAAPTRAPEKITQKLRQNPLQHDEPGQIELRVGMDEDGSFLRAGDGLPLRTISDTPHLTRALISRPNDNAIEVFQDDGAVVEQYRLSNLAEMIAFDCGEVELK
jgi:hypothetical protein